MLRYYCISFQLLNRIKPLLPLPKPKKKPGKPRKDDWKIFNGIFMSFLQAANGNHCQDVMERQVSSMIDFKSGRKLGYLK
jgi:transposase